MDFVELRHWAAFEQVVGPIDPAERMAAAIISGLGGSPDTAAGDVMVGPIDDEPLDQEARDAAMIAGLSRMRDRGKKKAARQKRRKKGTSG